MTLQLALTSSNDEAVGTAKLLATDPENVVSRVEFFAQLLPSGAILGPFASDRESAIGVFEKDVLLDSSLSTKVSAVVTLSDSSTATPTPAYVTFGAEDTTAPPPSIRALELASEYGEITVCIVPGAAHSWKCWLRPDAWPTADGTVSGEILEEYFRFEGNRDQCNFGLTAGGVEGTVWYVMAAGCDAAGNTGPFLTGSIPLTYGMAQRGSLLFQVLKYLDSEIDPPQREVLAEWIPNTALLNIDSSADEEENAYAVELFRAGNPAPLCNATLSESCIDPSVTPVSAGTAGSEHRTLEYGILLTDARDGLFTEYFASVSGSFINN